LDETSYVREDHAKNGGIAQPAILKLVDIAHHGIETT